MTTAVATPAATATQRLSALGIDVPAAPFTLGTARTWNTRNGRGSEIKVMQGRVLLGTLDDEGNGGGIWFRPAAPGANTVWKSYVSAFDGLTFDIWGDKFSSGTMPLGSGDDGKGRDEDVAILLAENALLLKDLKRHSKNGVCFLTGDDLPGNGYSRITGGPDSPAARDYLRSSNPGTTIRVWNDTAQEWQAI